MSTRGNWDLSGVRHDYAGIDGVRLHYVEAGEGPLVLLVHGYPEFWYRPVQRHLHGRGAPLGDGRGGTVGVDHKPYGRRQL